MTPDASGQPQDQDLPFIMHADRKISVEDVKFILSAHYEIRSMIHMETEVRVIASYSVRLG
ncbi:Dipeptidase A [Weissella viridescens]|uniref:Dipeptidase n=1 Tax=Weissella viridescens TaxID=1629 RepID=A0A380NY69_WEIVI|nr:Dipeptidase A [Weissella viridescens]